MKVQTSGCVIGNGLFTTIGLNCAASTQRPGLLHTSRERNCGKWTKIGAKSALPPRQRLLRSSPQKTLRRRSGMRFAHSASPQGHPVRRTSRGAVSFRIVKHTGLSLEQSLLALRLAGTTPRLAALDLRRNPERRTSILSEALRAFRLAGVNLARLGLVLPAKCDTRAGIIKKEAFLRVTIQDNKFHLCVLKLDGRVSLATASVHCNALGGPFEPGPGAKGAMLDIIEDLARDVGAGRLFNTLKPW